jgi:hypothetical protein
MTNASAQKRGRGRPRLPKGEARQQIFSIRLSADERKTVGEAAERSAAQSASDWARAVLLHVANATVSDGPTEND